MKSVLITGANGFIGTPLKNRLLEMHYTIYEFNEEDGDIARPESLSGFNAGKIDHIIHLAGKTFVPDSWNNPYSFYITNVMGTMNILQFCRSYNISLTFMSSYLYGIPESLPISEDAPLNPSNPYAHSKYLAEKLCQFYHRQFGVKITIFRPFNVYGEKQNKIFLIPTIINQILNRNEIKVKEVISKRDYIYIEDLIDAIILSLDNKHNFEIFNLGSGVSLAVSEVIEIIQKIFKSNKKVISENILRKNEISETLANINKAKQKLGWLPKYDFYNGITDLYKKLYK